MHEFLILLSDKGEVSSEIAAGVYVLREKSSRVNVKNAIDTCGTGGDGKNTLNISTASALLLASMGIMHKKYQIHGVQFHPESINTKVGMKIIENFVKI